MANTSQRKALYQAYLKSDLWKQKRTLIYQRANGRCEMCGRRCSSLECHHDSYANIFDEPLTDLRALCRKCHAQIHGKPANDNQIEFDFIWEDERQGED